VPFWIVVPAHRIRLLGLFRHRASLRPRAVSDGSPIGIGCDSGLRNGPTRGHESAVSFRFRPGESKVSAWSVRNRDGCDRPPKRCSTL
jgi:hypothetical protein